LPWPAATDATPASCAACQWAPKFPQKWALKIP
jgi:hypothetical protein